MTLAGLCAIWRNGSTSLHNREVQCLLQNQQGQIKKTKQFKKFTKNGSMFLKKLRSSNLNNEEGQKNWMFKFKKRRG